MGVTREDFVRSGRYLQMSDADWEQELATRKLVVENYMRNDAWAVKIKKRVAILLTASMYGLPYLKSTLESYRALGYWIVLSYDNFLNPDDAAIDYNRLMPPPDILRLCDTFIITHPWQTWGGVSYPFIFQLRVASGIFVNFDYVLAVNGDCLIEKPDGFDGLLDMLGDADIMSSGPALPREIGTAGILMRSDAFIKIAKHMNDHMVPFEEYEKSTQEFGNTEGRLAVAVRELGLKQRIVAPGSCSTHKVCEQLHVPGHGDWYDRIGFRHIHGEHNYAYRYKGIPPHYSLLDARFMGDEYNQIRAYWETKDMSIIEAWWAKD